MSVLSRFPALPRYLNPVLRPLASWIPPLAVLYHQGRTDGGEISRGRRRYVPLSQPRKRGVGRGRR